MASIGYSRAVRLDRRHWPPGIVHLRSVFRVRQARLRLVRVPPLHPLHVSLRLHCDGERVRLHRSWLGAAIHVDPPHPRGCGTATLRAAAGRRSSWHGLYASAAAAQRRGGSGEVYRQGAEAAREPAHHAAGDRSAEDRPCHRGSRTDALRTPQRPNCPHRRGRSAVARRLHDDAADRLLCVVGGGRNSRDLLSAAQHRLSVARKPHDHSLHIRHGVGDHEHVQERAPVSVQLPCSVQHPRTQSPHGGRLPYIHQRHHQLHFDHLLCVDHLRRWVTYAARCIPLSAAVRRNRPQRRSQLAGQLRVVPLRQVHAEVSHRLSAEPLRHGGKAVSTCL
ncbi:hypothetical protein LtaPh_1013251 [Leishmania tarentolae]|uniref:Uncharacterized protein n=1 Tax=Leishmania tarentolae TaxID=5689 RepID=A0A640KBK5_LEITA|nr:hypothetical protein LtaPh_1013251 [Leishmania tarentolae]